MSKNGKGLTFEQWLAEKLKDPKFKKGYEEVYKKIAHENEEAKKKK